MRASRLLLSVAVVTGFGVSACTSVAQTNGAQSLNVQVEGSSVANCTFHNDTVNEQGHFPGTLNVARSSKELQADCTGDGNKHVAFVVPATVTKAGPLSGVTNGMLPATSYDAATGGMYAYPDPVTVDFREISEVSPVTSDALAPAAGETIKIASAGTGSTATVSGEKMHPIVENATTSKSEIKTLTATKVSTGGKMHPVTSPEDKMGADPAKVKAAAKAKAEAAKKAKEAAIEKKHKAAQEASEAAAAKKAAEEAKAAAGVSTTTTTSEPTTAPAVIAAPATDTAPAATTTTTTSTTTTAPTGIAPVPSNDTPPAEPVTAPAATTSTTTTTTAPAATAAPTPVAPAPTGDKSDMDKYLQGQ